MKFKFGLDKVLKHRKILEDLAQKDFQEAMADLNQKIEKLQQFEQSIVDARQRGYSLQSQTGGQVLENLKQIHDFIILQDIRIEQQKKKVAEAEKVVEGKREILRQKAMDKKILERLKEKKRQEHKAETQRIEQKELDENVSMRFEKNKENRGL